MATDGAAVMMPPVPTWTSPTKAVATPEGKPIRMGLAYFDVKEASAHLKALEDDAQAEFKKRSRYTLLGAFAQAQALARARQRLPKAVASLAAGAVFDLQTLVDECRTEIDAEGGVPAAEGGPAEE